MGRKIKLLIVEDEEAIRNGLMDLFTFHGYEVDCAVDGRVGLEKSLSGAFDLIILDVMLPGIDGFRICDAIRRKDREQPIIMLTAKSSDEEIVHGLSLGADDYVAKPFSVAQLVLRVQAVLRRSRVGLAQQRIIRLGDDTTLDTENLSATTASGSVSFTRREMQVLQYLFANGERAVSRGELLSKVWGYARDLELDTRTVDIHIAKLRRKIEPEPSDPRYLVTVRGAGYLLTGASSP